MFMQSANFVLMAVGGFFYYPRLIGTIINCCLACPCHFTAFVMMFVRRNNPIGDLCSYNEAPSTYEGDGQWDIGGDTYEDDARKMKVMAVF